MNRKLEMGQVTTARTRRVFAALALAALAIGLAVSPAAAQRRGGGGGGGGGSLGDKELIPLIGYQWGGTYNYPNGSVHANAAMNYGGILSVPVQPGYHVELSYTYQGTDIIGRIPGAKSFKIADLGTHYIQISGRRDLAPPGQKSTPFVLGGLGTTVFSPGSSSYGTYNTQWLFSLNAGAGVNVAMNEKVGLRLQARLLLPINWVSGGLYFGSGGGGATISGGSAICQGDATLGIVLKLGK